MIHTKTQTPGYRIKKEIGAPWVNIRVRRPKPLAPTQPDFYPRQHRHDLQDVAFPAWEAKGNLLEQKTIGSNLTGGAGMSQTPGQFARMTARRPPRDTLIGTDRHHTNLPRQDRVDRHPSRPHAVPGSQLNQCQTSMRAIHLQKTWTSKTRIIRDYQTSAVADFKYTKTAFATPVKYAPEAS